MGRGAVERGRQHGRARTWRAPALLLACCIFAPAAAAASRPGDLPPAVRAALAEVKDETFSYAQPGFYALLEFVRAGPPALDAAQAVVLDDWRALLDRPGDFRGLPITIEGTVGRNSAFVHRQPPYDALGTLWEVQLRGEGQPIIAKLILTQDAGDLPLGAHLSLTARFALIQQYYSETNRLRQAAVFVGTGPSRVVLPPPPRPSPAAASGLQTAMLVATPALVVLWLLLRRRVSARREPGQPRASQPAPRNLSAELEEWSRADDVEERSGRTGQ